MWQDHHLPLYLTNIVRGLGWFTVTTFVELYLLNFKLKFETTLWIESWKYFRIWIRGRTPNMNRGEKFLKKTQVSEFLKKNTSFQQDLVWEMLAMFFVLQKKTYPNFSSGLGWYQLCQVLTSQVLGLGNLNSFKKSLSIFFRLFWEHNFLGPAKKIWTLVKKFIQTIWIFFEKNSFFCPRTFSGHFKKKLFSTKQKIFNTNWAKFLVFEIFYKFWKFSVQAKFFLNS